MVRRLSRFFFWDPFGNLAGAKLAVGFREGKLQLGEMQVNLPTPHVVGTPRAVA